MYPPEDYYRDAFHDYYVDHPSAPYEILEEYYTPDGRLVSAAPAPAAAAPPTAPPAGPPADHPAIQYVDPRLMKKY